MWLEIVRATSSSPSLGTDLSELSAQAQIRAEFCRPYRCFRSQHISHGCHFYGQKQGRALSSDGTTPRSSLSPLRRITRDDGDRLVLRYLWHHAPPLRRAESFGERVSCRPTQLRSRAPTGSVRTQCRGGITSFLNC